MDRSLKWRTIVLVAIILTCVGILMPTVADDDTLPSFFPFKKKINLGLDLQGGSHIVYSIDLDKAVDDRAADIKRSLETKFKEDGLTATVKTPPTPVLIRQAAGLDKAATTPGRETVGSITDAQVTEIAQIKLPDLNANDLDAAKLQRNCRLMRERVVKGHALVVIAVAIPDTVAGKRATGGSVG